MTMEELLAKANLSNLKPIPKQMKRFEYLKIIIETASLLDIKDEVRDALVDANHAFSELRTDEPAHTFFVKAHLNAIGGVVQFFQSLPFQYGSTLLLIEEGSDLTLTADFYEACTALVDDMNEYDFPRVEHPSRLRQEIDDNNAKNDRFCSERGVESFDEWLDKESPIEIDDFAITTAITEGE